MLEPQYDSIKILPKTPQQLSLIWLHGKGKGGQEFEGIFSELDLPEHCGVHFIFPVDSVSDTIGKSLSLGWYGIKHISLTEEFDFEGIHRSSKIITRIIENEVDRGIQTNNIFLAGFGQGGVLALYTALTLDSDLGGVLGLSSYLPSLDKLGIAIGDDYATTPVFMGHGAWDAAVPLRVGKQTYRGLKSLGYPVRWHEYSIGHEICTQEMKDLSQFIKKTIQSRQLDHE